MELEQSALGPYGNVGRSLRPSRSSRLARCRGWVTVAVVHVSRTSLGGQARGVAVGGVPPQIGLPTSVVGELRECAQSAGVRRRAGPLM